jgi:hypothetical protein
MPIQELLPSRPFNPVWSRRDAVILQNIGDRISSDRMTEIAEGALNPPITPSSVLLRHKND